MNPVDDKSEIKAGNLYGLGIGPGDPELLTIKAHRILTSVPVIAYPTMENGKVLARAIVADFIRPEQIKCRCHFHLVSIALLSPITILVLKR